jgi:hypothetical protein
MPKNLSMRATAETASFEERRLSRRYRMIVELTAGMISRNAELSHREARCLVECARKSILTLSPVFAAEFDLTVRSELERMIRDRWPIEEAGALDDDYLVN